VNATQIYIENANQYRYTARMSHPALFATSGWVLRIFALGEAP